MNFYSPWVLLLLLAIPAIGYVQLGSRKKASVRFASSSLLKDCPVSWRVRMRFLPAAARLACLALLIVALARPREQRILSEVSTEGVAMEVAVDHSGSMGIEMDYYGQKMSRLETVKKVIAEFIAGDKKGLGGRTGDLVGLVTFARYADTACPLVLGHSVLVKFLEGTQVVQMRSEDGTAIGDAIALASARLNTAEEEIKKRREKLGFGEGGEKAGGGNEEYKIKSKVVILLTDGINNVGSNPLEAAELARKWGVKIYAIGIGSGQSYMTIQTLTGSWKVPTGQELDEALLKSIAEKTGGFYSRADDAKSLKEIIEKINKLEKTEVKTVQYAQYKESFGNLTFAALLILAAEMIAGCTVLRKIP